MWKFLLWFTVTAVSLVGRGVVQAQCDTFDCRNGGTCVQGPATFSHPTKYNNGNEFSIFLDHALENQHCEGCNKGFTGVKCEVPIEECDDGAHTCFHGGDCMEGNEDLFGNDRHICDCTNARDDDGKRFVGKWCERVESNPCEKQDEFCGVNGTCVAEPGVISCTCDAGFTGDHCEFEADAVPDCAMDCKFGGQCRLGPLDLPDSLEYVENFWPGDPNEAMHCECTEGFFGLLCERESEPCGDKHCFHGAQCVEHTLPDDSKEFFCNCTPANTVSSNFAGKHCQYEALGFCSFAGQPGQLFCVNDGECPNNQEDGCTCPAGYSGTRCEFHESEQDIEEFQVCSTECENGGKCVKGVKDHGLLTFHMNQIGSIVNETANENFEHCLCPTDFAGLHCEHTQQTCGDNIHFCFNGGVCALIDPGTYGCDCSDTDYVGHYCQHSPQDEAVENCPTSAGFPEGSFCVNGVCDLQTDPTNEIVQYCQCESAYEGDHCEFLKGTTVYDEPTRSYETSNYDSNQKVIVSCVVVAAIGFVVIMLVIARTEFSKPVTEETDALASAPDGVVTDSSQGSSSVQLSPDSPVV